MRFWQMIGLDSSLGPEFTGSYDPVLVVLSVLIATLAAYCSLAVVERMSASERGNARVIWHAIGATAMGCGIWAMHFTAMLALSLPVTVSYDVLLTALSVVPAIVGSGCALHFMAQSFVGVWRLQLGALLMAVGIGMMHYTGMDAMRMDAAMRYDAVLFVMSILVAHVLSTVALYVRFKIGNTVRNRGLTTFLGAGVMGCTVAGMHYTAMAAARYYDTGSSQTVNAMAISPIVLAIIVVTLVTLFLGLTIIGALIDRRLEETNKSLQDSEARRKIILETMVDGLMTIDKNGAIESLNPSAERMFGYGPEGLVGKPQHATVHHTRRNGSPHPQEESPIYDTVRQGTVHRVDNQVFWRQDGTSFPVEYISTPLHDKDKLIGAVITFRDITERKRAEAERDKLHRQLVDTSRQAGQAEVATGVLHNVGNVLNSVNVSATLVADKVRESKVTNLTKASQLLHAHADDLATFLTEDEKGKQLPSYLVTLAAHLESERQTMLSEFESITDNISHIKQIVIRQQSYASDAGVTESTVIADLLDDALSMNVGERHEIDIIREYDAVPVFTVDKHKLLQIIVNLIRNAKQAINEYRADGKRIMLRIKRAGSGRVRIEVTDNGVGISEDNIVRLFEYGFTTKDEGHGFGLHVSANTAKELGGSLACHSDGPGKGATFTLELPLAVTEQAA